MGFNGDIVFYRLYQHFRSNCKTNWRTPIPNKLMNVLQSSVYEAMHSAKTALCMKAQNDVMAALDQ